MIQTRHVCTKMKQRDQEMNQGSAVNDWNSAFSIHAPLSYKSIESQQSLILIALDSFAHFEMQNIFCTDVDTTSAISTYRIKNHWMILLFTGF